jgi:hypothetical protein
VSLPVLGRFIQSEALTLNAPKPPVDIEIGVSQTRIVSLQKMVDLLEGPSSKKRA